MPIGIFGKFVGGHEECVCMCVYPEILKIEGKPTVYSYSVLKTATRNFHQGSKLGEGGFGAVYKVISILFTYYRKCSSPCPLCWVWCQASLIRH
jgi:hypothetical protein